MAAWRPGYQASPTPCACGAQAQYDLILYRGGIVRSMRMNLCRRCAHRQGNGAIAHADFVLARRIEERVA